MRQITPAMRTVEKHAIAVAREILQRGITVTFANDPAWPFAGTYAPGRLTFNVGRLGRKWFDLETNRVEIEKLLLHEFAHEFASDHLSHEYHESISFSSFNGGPSGLYGCGDGVTRPAGRIAWAFFEFFQAPELIIDPVTTT